jgi:CRP-like cAMP-binding protein
MGANVKVDATSAWSEVAEFDTSQSYPRGVALFRQGDFLRDVLFVTTGVVKQTRLEGDHRESILDLAFAGGWLGSAAAIAEARTPVSAITCTETCVSRMSATAFRHLVQHNRDLSLTIHRVHSLGLCRQSGRIGQLAGLTARRRLEFTIRRFILVLQPPRSTIGTRLRLPVHLSEVAALVMVSPEHLSRLLKEMQHEGVILREKGLIIVPDVQRLCPDAEHEELLW